MANQSFIFIQKETVADWKGECQHVCLGLNWTNSGFRSNAGSLPLVRSCHQPYSQIASLQGTLALFQDWAHCLTRMNYFSPLSSSVCQVLLLSPLHRGGNWAFGRLCNIPEVTQLLNGRLRTWTQLMRRGQALRSCFVNRTGEDSLFRTYYSQLCWLACSEHDLYIRVGWRRSVIKEILELRSLGMISIRNTCKNWPIADHPGKGLIPSSLHWQRRRWHPTPVLLPGKSHGRRSLIGCSPWGRWELDTTEQLPFHFSLSCIGEGNGNPLQCTCLENPRDRGAWWAAVYGVAQSQTWLKWLSSSKYISRCWKHSKF